MYLGDKLKEKASQVSLYQVSLYQVSLSKLLGQREPLEQFQCTLAQILQVSGTLLEG